MNRRAPGMVLALFLALSMVVSAAPITFTLVSPTNNSNVTAGHNYALLSVVVLNPNAGGANQTGNLSFFSSSGVLLASRTNISNGTTFSFNWTGLSVGAHPWKVNASSVGGDGTSPTFTFSTFAVPVPPASGCFANASGVTLIVLGVTALLLALLVGLMFLEAVGLEAIIGVLIVAVFIIPLLGSFC